MGSASHQTPSFFTKASFPRPRRISRRAASLAADPKTSRLSNSSAFFLSDSRTLEGTNRIFGDPSTRAATTSVPGTAAPNSTTRVFALLGSPESFQTIVALADGLSNP